MWNFRRVLLAIVCLSGTGSQVGWAEPAHADWIDDPYAPHATSGTTARLGSAVGFLHGEPVEVVALGVTVAAGRRFGRLALESELGLMVLQEKGGLHRRLGDGERLGVLARYDALRIGPRWVGANSLLALYVEGGAAVAWNHWYRPAANELIRLVPEDTKRVEGQLGFGVMIDHRLQEPIGLHRVGWFLGWRLALAPPTAHTATVCRGETCRAAPAMPDEDHPIGSSMLFQSSLAVTW